MWTIVKSFTIRSYILPWWDHSIIKSAGQRLEKDVMNHIHLNSTWILSLCTHFSGFPILGIECTSLWDLEWMRVIWRTISCMCLPESICSHARADTIQVVEHEHNFSKFYQLTISFLVPQFCTLESSLCVSSSDYWLISPFGSSLIKVVLNPKICTAECTHQTTSVHRMNS